MSEDDKTRILGGRADDDKTRILSSGDLDDARTRVLKAADLARAVAQSEDDIETVGWQSRRLVDPEEPRNKVLDEGEGKYFTAQGFKKSMFVYGAERPLPESGPLVVCEGVTDVWRYGPGAVAVLGKFASHYQRQVLLRLGRGRPLVIAFDGDARKDAEELASFLVEQKQESILYHDDHPIVVLPLSPEEDPASLRRVVLRERVASLFA